MSPVEAMCFVCVFLSSSSALLGTLLPQRGDREQQDTRC